MADTIYRNKNKRRPKKSETDKRRRLKVHKRRLIELGMKEDAVEKLGIKEARDLLRRPAKVAAAAK